MHLESTSDATLEAPAEAVREAVRDAFREAAFEVPTKSAGKLVLNERLSARPLGPTAFVEVAALSYSRTLDETAAKGEEVAALVPDDQRPGEVVLLEAAAGLCSFGDSPSMPGTMEMARETVPRIPS